MMARQYDSDTAFHVVSTLVGMLREPGDFPDEKLAGERTRDSFEFKEMPLGRSPHVFVCQCLYSMFCKRDSNDTSCLDGAGMKCMEMYWLMCEQCNKTKIDVTCETLL